MGNIIKGIIVTNLKVDVSMEEELKLDGENDLFNQPKPFQSHHAFPTLSYPKIIHELWCLFEGDQVIKYVNILLQF